MSGGTTAVSQTQKQQMIIIMGGLIAAFIILIMKMPSNGSYNKARTTKVYSKNGDLFISNLLNDKTLIKQLISNYKINEVNSGRYVL